MRNVLGVALLATIAGVLLVAGVNAFLEDLPSWKVAVMGVGVVAITLGTAAFCLAVFNRALSRPAPPSRRDVIDDTGWHELQDYRPPRQQLPAPRYINVPRFITSGQAQPWGAPQAPPVELQTVTDRGETLSVPLKYLMRFAGLATPARSEWSGKTTIYSDCRNFFLAHGLLDPAGHWRKEYPLPQRKEWLEQFEQAGDR